MNGAWSKQLLSLCLSLARRATSTEMTESFSAHQKLSPAAKEKEGAMEAGIQERPRQGEKYSLGSPSGGQSTSSF